MTTKEENSTEKIGRNRDINWFIDISALNGVEETTELIQTKQLNGMKGDKYEGRQVHFYSEKGFNFEEYLSLKSTRITSTDTEKGKFAQNPIDLREDSTISEALPKSIIRNILYGTIVK